MKSEYLRDGRAPVPENEAISRTMSRIRGKNTSPEIALRKALWGAGLRGYRLHCKDIPGRPDICFSKRKLAVFVHGCFWHRCPFCSPHHPNSHREFWAQKFARNIERDKRKQNELKTNGWRSIVLWECQIRTAIDACVEKVRGHFGTGKG